MNDELDTLELVAIAGQAAKQAINNSALGYDSIDDLRQDAILWCLEHRHRVERARMPDGQVNVQRVVAELSRHLHGIVGKEVAHRTRSEYVSEWHVYSLETVKRLLPVVWDDEYKPPLVDVNEGGGSHGVDPTRFGTYQATVIDLRQAVETALSDLDRRVLGLLFWAGYTQVEVAGMVGMSQPWVSHRVKTAVEALVEFLNGDGPYFDGSDTGGGVPLRSGGGSAGAQARTSGDYYGSDT